MWDLESQALNQGSETVGSGTAVFSGSGIRLYTIFVGSGTKIGHAFGIKDQKFAYKNGISIEKTYLVTTLILGSEIGSRRSRPSVVPGLEPEVMQAN